MSWSWMSIQKEDLFRFTNYEHSLWNIPVAFMEFQGNNESVFPMRSKLVFSLYYFTRDSKRLCTLSFMSYRHVCAFLNRSTLNGAMKYPHCYNFWNLVGYCFLHFPALMPQIPRVIIKHSSQNFEINTKKQNLIAHVLWIQNAHKMYFFMIREVVFRVIGVHDAAVIRCIEIVGHMQVNCTKKEHLLVVEYMELRIHGVQGQQ